MTKVLRSKMDRRLASRQAKKDEVFSIPYRIVTRRSSPDVITFLGMDVLSDDAYARRYYSDELLPSIDDL